MSFSDSAEIVKMWLAAANRGDIERLIELSTPDIELIGPRGSGQGYQRLQEWMDRAGLHLTTHRIFARDATVVAAQRAVWRSLETGEITGEQDLASRFRVVDKRVTQFARYDNLDVALDEAGLRYADELSLSG
jgi:ketosteroid isomerase-like protein